MRRILYYLFPLLILIFFTVTMNSSLVLKKSLSTDDDVIQSIKTLENEIKKNNWEQTQHHMDQLDTAWTKIIKRIQYSADLNEINEISMSLSRLRGALHAQDMTNSLIELNFCRDLWKQIGQ